MSDNLTLMRDAKASLRGKWGPAALATLIITVIMVAASFLWIGSFIVAGPMTLGYIFYLKALKAGDSSKLEVIFSGFNDFLRSFLTYLLMTVFVILWSLLLIIPGIVMSFAYSMAMFIIADDKDISAMDAIRRSRDMMRGYKWKYFCLQLRFMGWILLACLTLGTLFMWVHPYITMACLNFYNDVKADWEARGGKA